MAAASGLVVGYGLAVEAFSPVPQFFLSLFLAGDFVGVNASRLNGFEQQVLLRGSAIPTQAKGGLEWAAGRIGGLTSFVDSAVRVGFLRRCYSQPGLNRLQKKCNGGDRLT